LSTSDFLILWFFERGGRTSRGAGVWSSDASSTIYSVLAQKVGTMKKACEERLHSP
jgi:hypothetical protein